MATDPTTGKTIDFRRFCQLVNAAFDAAAGEWEITEKGFMAGFYSRTKTTDKQRALRDGFGFLNLIERYRAPLYMSGSTPLRNEIVEFDFGAASVSVVVHFNVFSAKHFYGLKWRDENGAGGSDPFSAAREFHFPSRAAAVSRALDEALAIFAHLPDVCAAIKERQKVLSPAPGGAAATRLTDGEIRWNQLCLF